MLIMIMKVIGDWWLLPNVVAEYKAFFHLFVALSLCRALQRKYLHICIFQHIWIFEDFLFAYICFNLFGYVVLLAGPLRPVRGSRPSDGRETPKVSDMLLIQSDVLDSCNIIVGLVPKDLDNCVSFRQAVTTCGSLAAWQQGCEEMGREEGNVERAISSLSIFSPSLHFLFFLFFLL